MSVRIPPPPLPAAPGQPGRWVVPVGSARALLLAGAARAHGGPVVMVTCDAQEAEALQEELAFFAAGLPVLHFPDSDTLPYDPLSPHPDLVAERIATLRRLPDMRHGVLLVPAAALIQRIAPREHIERASALHPGIAVDHDGLLQQLATAGYRRVDEVDEPGEYATRNRLVDVYPVGAAQPCRIALDGGTLAAIRAIDPVTRRSPRPLASIELLPAREFPLTAAAAKAFRTRLRERFEVDPEDCPLYRDMREGAAPAGIESWLPLLHQHTASVFDYLADEALFVFAENAHDAASAFWDDAVERQQRRADDRARPPLPPDELYLAPDALAQALQAFAQIELAAPEGAQGNTLGLAVAPELTLDTQADASATLPAFLDRSAAAALVTADSPGRREALAAALAECGREPVEVTDWQAFLDLAGTAMPPGPDTSARRKRTAASPPPLALTIAPLSSGFVLAEPALAVLTERELNGARARAGVARPDHAPRGPAADPHDLTGLAIGDPVVHVDNGVGRYQGLVPMELGGMHGEFLALEYAGGDKLYVPVARLDQVSRYAGSTPERAPLHALGNGSWERARSKAAAKVRDAAAELLALQAQRAARGGTALAIDRRRLAAFGERFPFEETPDQLQAIDAVLHDLAAPRAMDRVICGDVGFGKTEVALRAAFAVASAGAQVAVLVPTTLLARQHYETFAERFAPWPLRVAELSRFRSGKKLTRTLEQLASGEIDVVIGTHKLLQPDVHFSNLGLVIVDEEQRFGVRQKERFKQLRADVDLLTMTATPIPRTLNMALAGLRDLSLIATPPTRRTAVHTVVSTRDPALIREALRRELARGGQAYFLHNEVQDIEGVASELRELVPAARVGVAHGQMAQGELERVMADFLRRRFNVLVCTTIIETGIDIPNANTLLIDRAENFGLAQLQQLRGRVGRSHRRAFAYLLIDDPDAMTAEAKQRLDAFAQADELGAGFELAAHDLEIRGAGDLLGHEQSGQIEEIGLHLYAELLQRTAHALASGDDEPVTLGSAPDVDIELHAPALLPEDYIADIPTRLAWYRRIAGAADQQALGELEAELLDRFGLLPEPARQLFATAALRLMARAIGVRKLDLASDGGAIVFDPSPALDAAIERLAASQPDNYAREGEDTLRITLELADAADVARAAQEVLVLLGAPRPD